MNALEQAQRARIAELNGGEITREVLTEKYGRVYTTAELQEYFQVEGFLAPWVVVKRKSDGKRGSLEFTASPRFYFNFKVDEP